ncbi:hypothetical protein Misp01_64390 [Microtetraspora sp. NBRC 13810]|nr:hypothetical protein Misp01_64390 [Microtetraspora sp. NBRC 13810]
MKVTSIVIRPRTEAGPSPDRDRADMAGSLVHMLTTPNVSGPPRKPATGVPGRTSALPSGYPAVVTPPFSGVHILPPHAVDLGIHESVRTPAGAGGAGRPATARRPAHHRVLIVPSNPGGDGTFVFTFALHDHPHRPDGGCVRGRGGPGVNPVSGGTSAA